MSRAYSEVLSFRAVYPTFSRECDGERGSFLLGMANSSPLCAYVIFVYAMVSPRSVVYTYALRDHLVGTFAFSAGTVDRGNLMVWSSTPMSWPFAVSVS